MPPTPHVERHFKGGQALRDVVIGMADGLTVPFALAAGLTGAVAGSKIVITAGLAEVAAGAIAMGLGGYLAARGDAEHYASERAREVWEVEEKPGQEAKEVVEVLESYGLDPEESRTVVKSLMRRPDALVEFMMRFELGLEKPDPRRALRSGLTIGAAYVAGGMIPLAPYFFLDEAHAALPPSVAMTALALVVFGFVKAHFAGTHRVRGALQTLLVGGLAAGAAFTIARLLS